MKSGDSDSSSIHQNGPLLRCVLSGLLRQAPTFDPKYFRRCAVGQPPGFVSALETFEGGGEPWNWNEQVRQYRNEKLCAGFLQAEASPESQRFEQFLLIAAKAGATRALSVALGEELAEGKPGQSQLAL